MVSPKQGNFVKGMWIAKNTMLAQELVHKVRKFNGKNSMMVANIDMKKVQGWCLVS